MHVQYLTQQLYVQAIDDSSDIGNYFYDMPDTYKSRNAWVFPDEEKNPLRFVDLDDLGRLAGALCNLDSGRHHYPSTIPISDVLS